MELVAQRQAIADLENSLEERSQELESSRKKSIVNGSESGKATSSKHDLTNAREEIKGLKYVP